MDSAAWMRHALALAARGLGQTWPNPTVGCVLVKDGALIGEGHTAKGGRPHAEPLAIEAAGENARGSTAHVTLEPCAHHGQTPPCTDALIKAGISRVFISLEDPDPRTRGQGIARLQKAGIQVHTGLMASEAAKLNAGFLSRITRGRPIITLKLATTIDARIATSTGESRWITGPMARIFVHHLRATHDAILIGSGTARADNPMLDVRDLGPMAPKPVRIVLDGGLITPLTSKLAETANTHPTWLLTRSEPDPARQAAWQSAGAEIVESPATSERLIDLPQALQSLGRRGITRVLCEGGGALAASLLREGLVDELITITAAKAIGGDGIPAIAPLGIEALKDIPAFTQTEIRPLGPDTMIRWIPTPPSFP